MVSLYTALGRRLLVHCRQCVERPGHDLRHA